MSSYRPPEKRGRLKLSKNLARIYRATKCRECEVKITPMDFAKILGKFTKVKIQYEIEPAKPPVKKSCKPDSENNNARLKNNENGMVLLHKDACKKVPVKHVTSPKKQTKPANTKQNNNNNILKENNRQKRTSITQKSKLNNENTKISETNLKDSKQYGVTFIYPSVSNNEIKNIISLPELLPLINNTVLPSEKWNIDYLSDEKPKQDKVYDRIAAELEDLMYNDKIKNIKKEGPSEEFPSIMDILNETNDNKDSNDVEAMLLGNSTSKGAESMEVDNNVIKAESIGIPSTVDEELQKGVMIHIPEKIGEAKDKGLDDCNKADEDDVKCNIDKLKNVLQNATQVVFKHMENGKCNRLVTCMNNLIYSIELEGQSVELKGAPKFISSLEDLKVLLEIVNETKLNSFYVV